MLSRFNPGGAEAALETAVRLDPKQSEGHNWLGLALGSLGRTREAIEQFRMALALQSDYANARYNLARALVKSGQLDEAAQDFSALAAADPADAQVRNDFGELLLRMDKPDEALEQFDKALALDPANKTAQENRDLARQRSPVH
jgi:Tfp pilus assembly protein PilF